MPPKKIRPRTESQFKKDLFIQIRNVAVNHVRPKIKSKTFKRDLQSISDHQLNQVILNVPYFFAEYVHDGRGSIYARPGRFLVWWRDHRHDPRLKTKYPKTKAQIKRLTAKQFRAGVKRNKGLLSSDPAYMHVTKSVGPTSYNNPFFSDGMVGLPPKIDQLVSRQMDAWALEHVISAKDTARSKLK